MEILITGANSYIGECIISHCSKNKDLKFSAFKSIYSDLRMLCEALRNAERTRVVFG